MPCKSVLKLLRIVDLICYVYDNLGDLFVLLSFEHHVSHFTSTLELDGKLLWKGLIRTALPADEPILLHENVAFKGLVKEG